MSLPYILLVFFKEPTDKELALLSELEERTENSRLGCEIVLSKELDGITVWCPDSPPFDIP